MRSQKISMDISAFHSEISRLFSGRYPDFPLGLLDPHLALLQGDTQSKRLPPVRCASAGVERRGGGLCAAYVSKKGGPPTTSVFVNIVVGCWSSFNKHRVSCDELGLRATRKTMSMAKVTPGGPSPKKSPGDAVGRGLLPHSVRQEPHI
jgi:hypothetical protein